MSGTFGENLRKSRLAGRDPASQRPLSMERLGEMIGERLGTPDFPSFQIIWNWEHNKNQPDARDRNLILAIADALVEAGGLRAMEEANNLLDSGGYTLLRPDEQAKLFLGGNGGIDTPPPPPPPPRLQPFYVERASDRIALSAIRQPGVTITINGPHGFGKTLLLHRLRAEAAKVGKRDVYFDCQEMNRNDAAIFFQTLCVGVALDLGMPDQFDKYWTHSLGHVLNCSRYFEYYLLKAIDTSIVLMLDQADRLIHSPFRDEFFAMLRAWHNKRTTNSTWSRLDIVLAISMDPSKLVTNAYQSPFNVDKRVELVEFTRDEVSKLNVLFDSPLNAAEIEKVMELIGGHPQLTNEALGWLKMSGYALEAWLPVATHDSPDNPFASHLQRQLDLLHSDPALGKAMQKVIRGQRCPKDASYYQLSKAGLVRDEGMQVLPRCRLYADYFGSRL